jgi:hypothetical protein
LGYRADAALTNDHEVGLLPRSDAQNGFGRIAVVGHQSNVGDVCACCTPLRGLLYCLDQGMTGLGCVAFGLGRRRTSSPGSPRETVTMINLLRHPAATPIATASARKALAEPSVATSTHLIASLMSFLFALIVLRWPVHLDPDQRQTPRAGRIAPEACTYYRAAGADRVGGLASGCVGLLRLAALTIAKTDCPPIEPRAISRLFAVGTRLLESHALSAR